MFTWRYDLPVWLGGTSLTHPAGFASSAGLPSP